MTDVQWDGNQRLSERELRMQDRRAKNSIEARFFDCSVFFYSLVRLKILLVQLKYLRSIAGKCT